MDFWRFRLYFSIDHCFLHGLFKHVYALCHFNGQVDFLEDDLVVNSIDNFFSRYLVVTKSFSHTVINPKQALVIIMGVYGAAFFWTMMPVIGWSKYGYEVLLSEENSFL